MNWKNSNLWSFVAYWLSWTSTNFPVLKTGSWFIRFVAMWRWTQKTFECLPSLLSESCCYGGMMGMGSGALKCLPCPLLGYYCPLWAWTQWIQELVVRLAGGSLGMSTNCIFTNHKPDQVITSFGLWAGSCPSIPAVKFICHTVAHSSNLWTASWSSSVCLSFHNSKNVVSSADMATILIILNSRSILNKLNSLCRFSMQLPQTWWTKVVLVPVPILVRSHYLLPSIMRTMHLFQFFASWLSTNF